jgi:hypothetical protein
MNSKGYYVTPKNNTTENIYINKSYDSLNNLSIKKAFLLIDYIYFDTNEKKNFLDKNLTYIIEVVQHDNDKNVNSSNELIKINYNYLCKELIFISQFRNIVNGYFNDIFNYSNDIINGLNLIKTA